MFSLTIENLDRINYAQNIILKNLYNILPNDCVLTGGTALTRFYNLTHRFSEDLDIFGYNITLDKVKKWLKELFYKGFQFEILSTESGEAKIFHCMTIITPVGHDMIKVDFVDDIFSGCWLPVRMKTIDSDVEFRVDTLEAILHKKLYAVYSNSILGKEARTKDIIDIFVLFRDFFILDDVIKFYQEARDIYLPIEAIIRYINRTELNFDDIIGIRENLKDDVLKWKKHITKHLRQDSIDIN